MWPLWGGHNSPSRNGPRETRGDNFQGIIIMIRTKAALLRRVSVLSIAFAAAVAGVARAEDDANSVSDLVVTARRPMA